MEAVLVNATVGLQLRDRITCISGDAQSFMGRRLSVRRSPRGLATGSLRRRGGVALAAANQKELDKQRATMREWWLAQLEAKSRAATTTVTKPAVDQKELDQQRVTMREWWLAQLGWKFGAATGAGAKPAADQKELDKQRATMREWWLVQLASKNGAAASAAGEPVPDQQELDKQRAAMRKWWLAKQAAKAGGATAEAGATPKSMEEETIERELERVRAKYAARELEASKIRATQESLNQINLDKGRKKMRKWWLAKYETKKRSLGWEPYEPCWVLSPVEGSIASDSYELTGEGVIVGALPQTSYEEKPVVVDLPLVSSNHAKVYGKDVKASNGKFVREYFVRDLGSTNGTFLNNQKLRSETDVKLSPEDILKFADDKVTFVLKKGQRS